MHIIYATGQPRFLEFACARTRANVPAGAIVFAICDGTRKLENLDEDTFAAMTDEEYYTMRGLVQDAVQLEVQTPSAAPPAGLLRQLYGWLHGESALPARARTLHHSDGR